MKQVLLLISIVLLFFTVNTEAQLKPAQSQYLVEKGVLINPSFEQGYKGWVITGCTKSLVTETPYLDKSLKLTCTNETFSIKQVSASLIDFKNQQGAFDLQIKTTASGVNVSSITNGVRDNSYTAISDTTFKRFKEIGFIIGDTDNGIEVYSDTNFTGEIIVDNFKLGLGNLTQEISGAHFVGSLTWRNSSCFWDNNLSVYSSFGANNSCDPASKNGLLEPLTKVPAAIIPNARTDAEYMIEVQGNFLVSAATSCAYDLKVNGVQLNSDTQIFDAQWGNSLKNTVRFNTGGNKEIEIIYKKTSGVGSCQIYADAESGSRALTFIVHAFPDSKNTIVSQKSQSPNYAGFLSFSFMDGDLQGHLPADGRCVAKGLYPNYDSRVANLYGDCDAGTGANTGYNLPDMRGYFPRMVDTTSEGTAGVNPDNTVIGGKQADEFQSHNHQYTWGANAGGGVVGMNQLYNFLASANNVAAQTTASRGGNETRPSAISLMAYVRMADNNLVVGSFEQIETVTGDLDSSTANEFTGTINAAGNSISDTNFDIMTCTKPATGSYACTYTNPSLFASKPSVQIELSGGEGACRIERTFAVTGAFFNYNTFNDAGVLQNCQIDYTITRGTDYNKQFSGAVINAADSSQLIADTIRAEIVSDDLVKVSAWQGAGLVATGNPVGFVLENLDNFNAWDGNTFTSPRTTCYDIKFTTHFTAVDHYTGIEIDGSSSAYGWVRRTLLGADIVTGSVNVCVNSGQTINLYNNVPVTYIASNSHKISITETPTRESILENFNNANTTKCQTKYLSANVTANGNVVDLNFNNLTIGKKYSLDVAARYQGAITDQIVVRINNGGSKVCDTNVFSQGGYSPITSDRCYFTATGTSLDHQLVSMNGTYIGNLANPTDAANVTLCELPDTVIFTTEFN